MQKTNFKNRDGFVAIVAVGIFALLAIFTIIVQTSTMDTIRSIKNSNNYYIASDIADSAMGYMKFTLKNKGSGFNEEQNCKYKQGVLVEGGGGYGILSRPC